MKILITFAIFSVIVAILIIRLRRVSSTTLKCNFDNSSIFNYDSIYTCQMSSEKWEKFSIGITKIIGDHKDTNQKNSNVEALSFDTQKNVSFLPTKIENFFPNLLIINASEINLMGIYKENLKGLKKLKILNLNRNKIQGIKAGTFDDNLELEKIFLDRNEIKQIDAKSFDSLQNLKILHLSGNRCGAKFIDSDNVEKIIKEINDGKCSNSQLKKSQKDSRIFSSDINKNEKEITNLEERIDSLTRLVIVETAISVIALIFLFIISLFYFRVRQHKIKMNQPIINNCDKNKNDNGPIYDVPAPLPRKFVPEGHSYNNLDADAENVNKNEDQNTKNEEIIPVPKVRSRSTNSNASGTSHMPQNYQEMQTSKPKPIPRSRSKSSITSETKSKSNEENEQDYAVETALCPEEEKEVEEHTKIEKEDESPEEEERNNKVILNPFLLELKEKQRLKGLLFETVQDVNENI
ncbi:hypothetical protein PVAND_015266 [Polypedilum vanderplanki]|uniref:Uncharacterized protein n=1 Tax=Polypedilum vanderplanki TaxID=319348 RepID=A0A9J6BCI8_POLVA|nr:hypothetical protein PVAND_015266 [Polypedilum vanderplanki]